MAILTLSKKILLLSVFTMFIVSCGGESGSGSDPTPANTNPTATVPACKTGDNIKVGESCTYNGGTFTVGTRGCLDDTCSGGDLVDDNFSAVRQIDGSYTITINE